MEMGISPANCSFRPVAVTRVSAGRWEPEVSWMPDSVTWEMVAVSMAALRDARALKKSPSGLTQRRWSQGLYFGLKCGFRGVPSGRRGRVIRSNSERAALGKVRQNLKKSWPMINARRRR